MIQLFTHTDLDGVGCAILAQLAYGYDNVNVTYCNYDDINEKVMDFLKNGGDSVDEIHITDISVNDEVATVIDDSDIVCRLLDHHSTAYHLNKYVWCNVMESLPSKDLKTSGTELYYLYLNDKKLLNDYTHSLTKFVEIVRDWDTWRWSSMGEDGEISKKMNDLFYLYDKNAFINKCISDISESRFPELSDTDKLVLCMGQRNIDKYVELKHDQMIRQPFLGHLCGFVFADRYFSELGNRLCKLNPDIDFVAMIDLGSCKVSYRTIRDDINLGEDIAKPLGGGGHPKSAGSTISKNISFEIIKVLIGC